MDLIIEKVFILSTKLDVKIILLESGLFVYLSTLWNATALKQLTLMVLKQMTLLQALLPSLQKEQTKKTESLH